jgi:hypothetical protein
LLVVLLAMLGIVLLASLVVVYVAYPHRGHEVPRAPWIGDAMRRGVASAAHAGQPDQPGDRARPGASRTADVDAARQILRRAVVMGYRVPEQLLLIIGIAVVFVAWLRRPRHHRARGWRRAAPREDAERAETPLEPRVGDDAETPRDSATRTIEDRDLPGGTETAERVLEVPESRARRLVRLRQRLARTQSPLGRGLLALLSRDLVDEDTWEEIEDTLITADVGVHPTQELVARLRTRVRSRAAAPASVQDILREELVTLVDPSLDRSLAVDRRDGKPAVVLVVGVNGTGKTTTVGKLARILVAEDKQRRARRRGHVPGCRRRAAGDLGRAGRRPRRTRCRGQRSRQRRVRGGADRYRAGGRRGARRHRRPAAEQGRA